MEFFYNSQDIDWMVLRSLDHIKSNWDLSWDQKSKQFIEEEDSYAKTINSLFKELQNVKTPENYHNHEDIVVTNISKSLNWNLVKKGKRWVGEDYGMLLEQGGFHDLNEKNLVLSAKGRIQAAIKRGQTHFDEMEESHKEILSLILSIILYLRTVPEA